MEGDTGVPLPPPVDDDGEPVDEVTRAAAETQAARSLSAADRGRIQAFVLLSAAALSLYVMVDLLAPFTPAVVLSAVLALLARPVQERTLEVVGNATAAALLVASGLFLTVLLPLAALTSGLVAGMESGVPVVMEQVRELARGDGPVWAAVSSLTDLLGVDQETVASLVEERLTGISDVLAGGTVGVLSGLGGWAVQAGVGLVALFYLLRDGRRFVDFVRWLIPLDRQVTDALLIKSREVVSATVFGALVVAMVQGTLGGLLFWALGLPAPALWGAVMAFFSLLPAVGPPVVWIPTAAILALSGDLARAAILTLVGGLVISTVDNLLRAVLVGDRARLHPLIVFFAVLGGLVVYGAAGFFLGPILVVLAISVLEMVRVVVYEEMESTS
ncbi:MAG: AI-2E family transporter [Longimicrobiales bacterium]|nr:AI-2E family transporter [Longimicrobiales bacterium]